VTLPNVTTGTRTVTLDAARNFRTLAINQSTAGATNRLLFNANLTSDSNTDLLPTLNATAGTIVIDKGSYYFDFTSGGTVRNWILGPNVILNSSGGRMQDGWQTDKSSITLQGTANFITAATALGDNGNKFTVDTTGVLNLTSGGGASVGTAGTNATVTIKGTVNGDGSGTITAPKFQLMAGSAMSGMSSLTVGTFDLRTTNPATINLSATTLQNINSGGTAQTIEVGANATGSYLINKLRINGGSTRVALVDNYDNDLSSAAAEHLEVNTLEWAGSNYGEFDLNGVGLTVNTALTFNPYGRTLSNRKAGSTSTLTLGGTLDLGSLMNEDFNGGLSLAVKNNATLDIVQNVPMTYLNVGAGSGTIKIHSSATGSGRFGAYGGIHSDAATGNVWTNTDVLTVDLAGNTYTNNNGAGVVVEKGASLKIIGSVVNGSADGAGRGLVSATNGTRLEVTGNYTSAGNGGRVAIGSNATLKVGGNFLPGAWWGGYSGSADRIWSVNTSANAGSFILNGGGSSLQTFEVLSKTYSVSGDSLVAATFVATVSLPFGNVYIGDPSGSAAWAKLTNAVNNSGFAEDTQVARSLTVTTNSVFDIAQYKMVVALGTNSVVAGLITNSVAGGQLIFTNGMKMVFMKGGAIDVATNQIAADCVVDFNAQVGSYIRVNGDQKAAFDALVAGGQITNTGGTTPEVAYTSADDRTTVIPPPPPRGTSVTLY
jgi:hypothetical protein